MTERGDLTGRNGRIWLLYCEGWTQERLAAEYGLTRERISQILKAVRDTIPQETREEEIQRSLEVLHDLRAGALEVWKMAAAPMVAGKDGDPVVDPESGEYVRDHGGRLRALETALKVDAQIRQLLGLDAAQRMDHTIITGESGAAERLAREAAARVTGEDPST